MNHSLVIVKKDKTGKQKSICALSYVWLMRASMNWERPRAHNMWYICTVYASAVISLVSCELEKVQNYSVISPKTSEISQPVRSRIATLNKNGECYLEIAIKFGFTFSTAWYAIKPFLVTKSFRNDHHSGWPKKLNNSKQISYLKLAEKSI